MIYIKLNTIVLEKPTKLSIEASLKKNEDLDTEEIEKVKQLKKQELGITDEIVKKRRKFKGPNPLSCKKKKKKLIINSNPTDGKVKKRTRKRLKVKLAKHVKKILDENNVNY